MLLLIQTVAAIEIVLFRKTKGKDKDKGDRRQLADKDKGWRCGDEYSERGCHCRVSAIQSYLSAFQQLEEKGQKSHSQ
ncbi:MAG: hypothetical protein IPH88_00050 [Bacteroidales bacterium]|nr:hypothetical protein [Bacteroidales bacterium]